ncbi:MAG: hypothetical protein HYR84_04265 [Planctomycetes bacterium]|nr:hypothetical protein [Planctomycetota bacterium]
MRRAKQGKRIADKLFKVWLKDGVECWVLVHVEIQGDAEKEFAKRMFEYHVAIRQMYNQDVVSLAALCDDEPQWRPGTFAFARWGCRIEFTFPIVKLLDYATRYGELEASDNPIATIVLAHLETMQTRDEPAERKNRKLRLAKGLLRRNWSMDDIREVFLLIDWLMTLPDDLHDQFLAEIHEFEKEATLPFIPSFERAAMKRGLTEGLLEGIALLMDMRFGARGRKLMPAIRTIADPDRLRKLARFLKKAETLDEVREYLK